MEVKMKNYLVTWSIQLSAVTPEGAIYEAYCAQKDPHTMATFFDVYADDTETNNGYPHFFKEMKKRALILDLDIEYLILDWEAEGKPGPSFDDWIANGRPLQPQRAYSVLLQYPDSPGTTYYAWVDARTQEGAVVKAKRQAAEDSDGQFGPDGFQVLLVINGHHEDIYSHGGVPSGNQD